MSSARAVPVEELAVYVGEGRRVRVLGAAGVLAGVEALDGDRRGSYLIWLRGESAPVIAPARCAARLLA